MTDPLSIRGKETGYGEGYQRTAEIESRFSHGLDISDRYDKEVDFVLKSADLNFQPADKVLDLASGVGEHAVRMAKKLGVHVDAREYEEAPVLAGRKKLDEIASEVRDRVTLAQGDMSQVKKAVPDGASYKMVTILGNSFMYLPTKEAHQQALKDYSDVLEPGGKLVIQFRETTGTGDPMKAKELHEGLHVSGFGQKADGPNGKFGIHAKPEENVYVMKDDEKGDGFYFYNADVENKTGLKFKQNRSDGLKNGWYDSDDVAHSAFGRAYFDANGNEQNLGVAQIIDYISRNGYQKALKSMLEKAGFTGGAYGQRTFVSGRINLAICCCCGKTRSCR